MCARCPYAAYDYCHRCQAPLCEHCMRSGCCGDAPAPSGVERDYADHLDAVYAARYGDLGIPAEDLA
jgi:hypothetical protein